MRVPIVRKPDLITAVVFHGGAAQILTLVCEHFMGLAVSSGSLNGAGGVDSIKHELPKGVIIL
jgi:hypothetical protein